MFSSFLKTYFCWLKISKGQEIDFLNFSVLNKMNNTFVHKHTNSQFIEAFIWHCELRCPPKREVKQCLVHKLILWSIYLQKPDSSSTSLDYWNLEWWDVNCLKFALLVPGDYSLGRMDLERGKLWEALPDLCRAGLALLPGATQEQAQL